MIITFALLGLFIVASSLVITSSMDVYYKVKGTSNGIQVSDFIMDKIEGSLQGARMTNLESEDFIDESGNAITAPVIISKVEEDKKNVVEFTDRTGSHVNLSMNDEGYLNVHYYQVDTLTAKGDVKVLYKAVDWKYDSASYMGYKIEKLTFEKANMAEYKPGVIKVTMVIKSSKYGEYSTARYVDCYNISAGNDANAIVNDALAK